MKIEELEQAATIENIAALPAFYELVDFASEVCLQNPGRVSEIVQRDMHLLKGQQLVGNVWSARSASEYQRNIIRNPLQPKDIERYLSFNESIGCPRLFGPPPIPEVQLMVKAFGEAMLEEAFECLGDDAPAMVEKWRKNESEANRREVTSWLLGRIIDIRSRYEKTEEPDPANETSDMEPTLEDIPSADEMVQFIDRPDLADVDLSNLPVVEVQLGEDAESNGAEEELDDNNHFYHPLRLSPKLLGKYPETATTPTCLAISILAAAFFHKAGEPVIHSGVMRTAYLEAHRFLMITGSELALLANKQGITLPDDIMQNIAANEDRYVENRDRDTGFHASVFAGLTANKWVHVDPNYNNSVVVGGEQAEELTDLSDYLSASSNGLGGVEATLKLNDWQNVEHLWFGATEIAEHLKEHWQPEGVEALLNAALKSQHPLESLTYIIHQTLVWSFSTKSGTEIIPGIVGEHLELKDALERSTPETKTTKVIMLTALSQSIDRERGQKLGVNKYLVKSQITLEDVVETVKSLLAESGGSEQKAKAPDPNASIDGALKNFEANFNAPARQMAKEASSKIKQVKPAAIDTPTETPPAPGTQNPNNSGDAI